MKSAISARLSVMMFLQFFVWGVWYVPAYNFLLTIGFGGDEIKWTYSVGPIAGIISPFFLGMIADRFFSSERVLGVLHLLGGGALLAAVQLMQAMHPSPLLINLMLFAHMLCYFPTLALVNTLSMHNMTNSEKQFPMIRVFGTAGWIAAGALVSLLKWDGAVQVFYVAAAVDVVLGLYCFTLPHTPPPSAGKKVSIREVLGIDAFVLLKQRSYFTFMLCSFLICIPLAFYYQMGEKFITQKGISNPTFTMTYGQMSEVVFMLLMPFFFARLGVKWMLAVGMLAWVVRYGLFAAGAPDGVVWMLLGGILLHGICYDFFFVTGQIYTDKVAPTVIRGQAQGMLVLFTLGLGMLIGAQVAGATEEYFATPEAKALKAEADKYLKEAKALKAEDPQVAALKDKAKELKTKAAAIPPRWQPIWAVPAIGAAVVLALFVLIFRDTTARAVTEGEVAAAAAREEMT